MPLLAGFVLLAAGLLAAILGVQMRERRFFDRPALARHRMFDPALRAVAWLLGVGGLGQIGRASAGAASGVAGALALLWGYRRLIRSVRFQAWLLKSDYEKLRRSRPGLPDTEVLYELAIRRNPRWGEELIAQMVLDYPTFEELAPMIAKMERGFRGFH